MPVLGRPRFLSESSTSTQRAGVACCVVALLLLTTVRPNDQPTSPRVGPRPGVAAMGRSDALILDGGYKGELWRKPNATASARVVLSSPFAQCELHEVYHPTKPGVVIQNWLWFDERDHVNVAVHGRGSNQRTDRWIAFRQTKYAFRPGRPALAPVGGYINDGEVAEQAARREVLEELGLECRDWRAFGEYRTAANRGGGFIHPFVARQCEPSVKAAPSDDLESQARVYLTDTELQTALFDGSFQEIKWSATIAFALLQQQQR